VSRPPTLRVASGAWKGRRLDAPASARPTSGRARAALFDILQERIPGARLLELYAGSGAVGLEALSRGASRVVFVERDAAALRRNLERLSPEPGTAELLTEDAIDGARRLRRRSERFDVVFADPPYGEARLEELAARAAPLLAPDGILVLQADASSRVGFEMEGLRAPERRAYGRNVFWLFSRAASESF
jgi:16S rRNA (guanine(966)-N(2))-methyltransferase RsmD